MSGEFTAAEIAELGVQIEENGFEFYTGCAERATDVKIKEVFVFLAGEEKRHIAAFKKIHDSALTYQPEELYPDEYFAYMKELAAEHVFSLSGAGQKAALSVTIDRAAIDLALTFEKESIAYFEEMKKSLASDESGLVERLIEQEKIHIEKLTLLKSTYA
jgi:rubrerythrin